MRLLKALIVGILAVNVACASSDVELQNWFENIDQTQLNQYQQDIYNRLNSMDNYVNEWKQILSLMVMDENHDENNKEWSIINDKWSKGYNYENEIENQVDVDQLANNINQVKVELLKDDVEDNNEANENENENENESNKSILNIEIGAGVNADANVNNKANVNNPNSLLNIELGQHANANENVNAKQSSALKAGIDVNANINANADVNESSKKESKQSKKSKKLQKSQKSKQEREEREEREERHGLLGLDLGLDLGGAQDVDAESNNNDLLFARLGLSKRQVVEDNEDNDQDYDDVDEQEGAYEVQSELEKEVIRQINGEQADYEVDQSIVEQAKLIVQMGVAVDDQQDEYDY